MKCPECHDQDEVITKHDGNNCCCKNQVHDTKIINILSIDQLINNTKIETDHKIYHCKGAHCHKENKFDDEELKDRRFSQKNKKLKN